jgi:CheY-like chemotaxis protein
MASRKATRARVLIVDDGPDTRAMSASALHDGYEVVRAAMSGEALTPVRERVPDAIVVDQDDARLPPRHGERAERLRVRRARPESR